MERKDIFKAFLETNEVLIVDKNPSSRSRLLKTMYDLGAKRHMIHSTGSISEAEVIVNSKKIGIVLSDYLIGGGSGFDLFKMIRAKNTPEVNKNLCLILVTSNISQSAVAKAAEEDVDSFIIKPYTVQSIQENLISTVVGKIAPSTYIKTVDEGKSLINIGKYDEALVVLKEALDYHTKPALALFYIGQAELLKAQTDQASGSYNKGLSFNNIHYKCLVGLYELLMKQNKYAEAYQVVKKVAKYFPANPERLTQVIRLTIQTENYEDMQQYYEIFTQLEERSGHITNYLGAGMFIAGKHCLLNDKEAMGIKFFDNVAVSCSEHTKFIRAMISLLVEQNKPNEAMKLLSRFPAGYDEHEDYLVCDFLINSKFTSNPGNLVKAGLDVYNRKIRDYQCMLALVTAMEKAGLMPEKIETFKKEIVSLWPEKASA
ncbi:MAG TPA: response regulator [Bacteriovoracaceae bacterium]|nr:response regulator [Bacteriovoracaceae bacterium]